MRTKAYLSAIVLIIAILCGCGSNAAKEQVDFYYCTTKPDYSSTAGIIRSESHNLHVDPSNYRALLSQYLKGPTSSELKSPFPTGCEIMDITLDQSTARITMNSSFAALSGVELTLACACISLTARSITGYATVEIRAADTLLDNRESIIIDTNNILLTDAPA